MAHGNQLTTPDDTERIEQALLAMPARTRTIFLLHRLDGLTYAAIAERCGIGVNEVERHIAEAMLQLDRALDDRRPPWWRRWLGRRR
jgi:RNA polymerase sigma-70 factor (ECF subfamily)